jgi:hypothetical protein
MNYFSLSVVSLALVFVACDDGNSATQADEPSPSLETEGVAKTCIELPACDAMVKSDVSTWHFTRKDDFGDDVEYTYSVSGRDLIVSTSGVNGSNTKTLSMYNMESEVGVEMAFSAAKSTCKG